MILAAVEQPACHLVLGYRRQRHIDRRTNGQKTAVAIKRRQTHDGGNDAPGQPGLPDRDSVPGDGGSVGLALYTAILATASMAFVYLSSEGNVYLKAFVAILAAATAAAIMAFGFANALSLAVPLGGIAGGVPRGRADGGTRRAHRGARHRLARAAGGRPSRRRPGGQAVGHGLVRASRSC